MKTTIAVVFLAGAMLCRAADLGQLESLYRSILDSPDDAGLPDSGTLATQELDDSVKALSADGVRILLPIAIDCVHSNRLRVRQAGLTLFISASLRTDSAALLDPYIADLGGLLRASDAGTRKAVIFLLAQGLPTPSPEAWRHLQAHMRAATTTPEEFRLIAGSLLQQRPGDATAVYEVLLLAQARKDPGITAGVVNNIGSFRITTDEALAFVRASLSSPDANVRRESVRAAGLLDRNIRSAFTEDLQRIADNPDESADLRRLARSILLQAQ